MTEKIEDQILKKIEILLEKKKDIENRIKRLKIEMRLARKGIISTKLGETLKILRVTKGVSLKEVEKKTGISNAYISQLETGTRGRYPSITILNRLADYYGITIGEFLVKAGYECAKKVETYTLRTKNHRE